MKQLLEIFLISLGVSMDAFAVSVCLGLNMRKATLKRGLLVGLYFGFFQAFMPLIGYLIAKLFADKISAFDHWVAFILLCFLGVKMALASFKRERVCADRECPKGACSDRECPQREETSLAIRDMLPYALATSIDALAVGISLALLEINIFSSVGVIGIVTLILSVIGVKIGSIFGTRIKSKAELLGGIILILIGIKILLEHIL